LAEKGARMSQSAHDWFHPRLIALLEDAHRAGFAQDVSIAVVSDLLNGPDFSPAEPGEIDERWAKDIGAPDYAAGEMAPPDSSDTGVVPGERIGGSMPGRSATFRNEPERT
jgi:hypothetical protein